MPLSELYRLAKRRLDSNQEFEPANDVFELVFQNGQITTTQGQSSRPKKDPISSTNTLPSYTPKSREKDSLGFASTNSRTGVTMSVPSQEVGNNLSRGDEDEDDMIPWLSYQMDVPLQTDYCPEFLPELSGVTVNEISKVNNAGSGDYCANLEQRNVSKPASTSFPSFRSRLGDSVQKQDSVINFSHFSRPIALARANSGLVSNKDKGKLETFFSRQSQVGASSGAIEKPRSCGRDFVAVCRDDALKNDTSSGQIACESTTRALPAGEKNNEPVVASSSVCSGNSGERASDDLTHALKRKCRDTEDSECHSEDIEEDSVGGKKTVLPRGSGSKRSRAAEVHNLSERRRRDRINEKMRALQELIPNCNKVDKASMLDEAIEYLKTLQLQVQIMSMGAGLCMPPMMLPPGMQHMAHFPPMGIGMGMGMGVGMGLGMGFGMGMPDMTGTGFQGPHFPGVPMQPMAGPALPVFGIPSQGMSMPIQRPQLVPMMGGPFLKPAMAVDNKLDSTSPITAAHSSMNQTSSQCQATNEGFKRSASVQNIQRSDANAGKTSDSTNDNDVGPSRAANYD